MPHDNPDTEQILSLKQMQATKSSLSGKKLNPTSPKTFWSYPFMVAIMACLQVICSLYIRRFMVFFGFDISVGSLILLPVILYTFQIVAECYGWQYSRQIVWLNFIVNGLVTILTFSFGLIPYSSFNHDNLKMAYINLADTMWINSAMTWVLVFLSDYITSALMCSSRFQFNGRFVLPRMLILHLLWEIIILSGNFVVLPANGYSIEQTWHIVVSIFLARTISSLMLLPLARLVVWFIQNKIEGVVVFDYRRDFSLFKFKVDNNMLAQFCAKKWNTLSAQDKKELNIERAVLLFQSTNAVISFRTH